MKQVKQVEQVSQVKQVSKTCSTCAPVLPDLPAVSTMMRDAGLEPKKQFGQNFLFDLNLTGKIARAVPDIENSVVIEVGPGPGGLTRALLLAGAKRVIAIEKDKTTKPILDKIIEASDGRLEVIYGDALKESVECRVKSVDKLAVCSNLPYNIGTELLIYWLHNLHSTLYTLHSLTLMFQREVAERIVAKVGDKQYGRLSVLTELVADAKILFNVPNTAFFPAPKVQSAVVQIIPKRRQETGDRRQEREVNESCHVSPVSCLPEIEKLTAKLFGQRRKMIRGIMPDVDWTKFGLTGTERAEELSPLTFAEIANQIVI